MKIKFIILTFFLFVAFFNETFAKNYAPSWYQEKKIACKDYEFVGYGNGKTLDEAKSIAKKDIAEQIYSKVQTNFEKKENLKKGNYLKEIDSSLKITSSAILTDTQEVKREFYKDRYFIAIKYINLPLLERALVKLGKNFCSNKKPPVFLKKSLFYKELEKSLNCKPYFEIKRMHNLLRLFANKNSITLRKDEFNLFLQDNYSPDIAIKTPKRTLKETSVYFLDIETKQKGFVSLFNINENAQVFKLFENKKIEKKITYPDRKIYNGLEAIVLEDMEEGKDLFVAIFSKTKIDFSLFIPLSVNVEKTGYDFMKFIKAIDKYNFTSIIIRTIK